MKNNIISSTILKESIKDYYLGNINEYELGKIYYNHGLYPASFIYFAKFMECDTTNIKKSNTLLYLSKCLLNIIYKFQKSINIYIHEYNVGHVEGLEKNLNVFLYQTLLYAKQSLIYNINNVDTYEHIIDILIFNNDNNILKINNNNEYYGISYNTFHEELAILVNIILNNFYNQLSNEKIYKILNFYLDTNKYIRYCENNDSNLLVLNEIIRRKLYLDYDCNNIVHKLVGTLTHINIYHHQLYQKYNNYINIYDYLQTLNLKTYCYFEINYKENDYFNTLSYIFEKDFNAFGYSIFKYDPYNWNSVRTNEYMKYDNVANWELFYSNFDWWNNNVFPSILILDDMNDENVLKELNIGKQVLQVVISNIKHDYLLTWFKQDKYIDNYYIYTRINEDVE